MPRFFGLKSLHSFEEGRSVPKGWLKYWIISVISGTLLLASFVIEFWLNQKAGLYLRAFTVSAHLFAFVPGMLSLKKCNALGLSIRWVPWCAAVGWLAIIFVPGLRTGVLHLMFIGGSAIVMLAVSTRVILGHNDRHDRLALPMKWYHLVWSLLLLTTATRLSADFVPKVRISHLSYAACLWIIVIVFWSVKIRRDLKSPLPSPSTRGNCPKRKRKQ
ncbi:MAG: NnrS family protein [Akkermansiaceae bacterium]|nr:NnrS family protein [Akkermansiaceae bacterium]